MFLARIYPSAGDNRADKLGANPPAMRLLLRAKRKFDPSNQLLGCWVLDIRYDVLETSDIDLGIGQDVLDYWNRLRGEAFARLEEVEEKVAKFGMVNWVVVGAYLLGMVGIGYWFMRRKASAC